MAARNHFYFVCFRLGKNRFKRTLQTSSRKEADGLISRLGQNLRDVERGRLVIPENADVVQFLRSDGRVTGPTTVDQTTLKELFDGYFNSIPAGSMEDSTIAGMKIHRGHLERHFSLSFSIRTLSLEDLQGYVGSRSVNGTTIKKEVMTLRTVWNWGVQAKLVSGSFPNNGLKYPKFEELPPFMEFDDVVERTKRLKGDLPVKDIEVLLKHVEGTGLPFVYPMFCFAAHTGARRSRSCRPVVRS